jgi:hypothetical protein
MKSGPRSSRSDLTQKPELNHAVRKARGLQIAGGTLTHQPMPTVKRRERRALRFDWLQILESCVARRPRKGNYVADIGDARQKH